MSGAIDNSADNRMEAAPPDLSEVIADYYWRTNQATGMREYVRSRDGFVVDRKPIAGGTMKAATQARSEEFVGEKFGALTIRRISGQHATSGAVLVDADCECGNKVEGAMLSDIKGGRKPYCNGLSCPVARRAREASRKSKGRRLKPAAPPRKRDAKVAPDPARERPARDLIEKAATLRRAAVMLLKSETAPGIVAMLRSEADKIDEEVYG